jgi:hypothetical protein
VIVVQARHVTAAEATHVISTNSTDSSNATGVKAAAHATSTEAAHVTSAKAAHPTTMSSAASAAGLRTRGKKAAGKHCARQNHHHSSSHNILHLRWADFPPQGETLARLSKEEPTSR